MAEGSKLLKDLQLDAVCLSMRSVAIENRCPQAFPKLVIPGETNNSETRRCLDPITDEKGYFSFSAAANNNSRRPEELPVPVPHQYYCCGSSLGWLVLIDDNFDMQLFNPVSRVKFDLPSSKTLPPAEAAFTKFCKFYVNKAVISSDPTSSTSSQTIVLIIYAGAQPRLAFCKLGDESWTPIETPNRYYLDAIYYNDKFYAVYDRGGCDIIDIDNQAAVAKYALRPPEEKYTMDLYILESKGELYLAVRIICFDNNGSDKAHDQSYDNDEYYPSWRCYRTVKFRVYKLEEEDGIRQWMRVKNIGDNAFFVGYNSSFSLQASDYFGCCKPNSIYFTASDKPLPWTKPIRHDIGIFNLENRSVESIFPVDSKPVRPPPFWFTPNV